MSNVLIYDEEKLLQIAEEHKDELEGVSDRVSSASFKEDGEYVRPCTVEEILKAILTFKVTTYTYNRGTGTVSLKTVNDVDRNYDNNCIDEIVIGRFRGKVRLGDGHSRAEGLLRRFVAGNLTEAEKKSQVSVRVVPESKFLYTYEKRNATAQHKISEMITNPDYMFGNMFVEFNKRLGNVWDNFDGHSKLLQQLTYLIHYFSTVYSSAKGVSYAEIFYCRTETKKLVLSSISEAPYTLTDSVCDPLCNGLKFYVEVMDIIKAAMTDGKILDVQPLKTIIGSSPLMGLIVADYASGEHNFKTSPIKLAKRIMRKASELAGETPCMTHSGGGNTRQTEQAIRQLLIPDHA